jgi:hypothetical protein
MNGARVSGPRFNLAEGVLQRPYRSWVEVSLRQIADNFDAIRKVVTPSVEVMPAVKGNACGHGVVEVATALCARGARWLAVSSVEEGVTLRQAGITARILVLADFLPWSRAAAIQHSLTPVLYDLADLKVWDRLNESAGQVGNYHLKTDSGLWRLGTREAASDIVSAIRACPHIRLEGLMTHFAAAADYSRNVDIVVATGQRYLSEAEEKYDLIVLDAEGPRDHPDPRQRGKRIYEPLLESARPHVSTGSMLVCHNIIFHDETGSGFMQQVVDRNRDELRGFMKLVQAMMPNFTELFSTEGVGVGTAC